MNVRVFLFVLGVLILPIVAQAEIIMLKDGSVVNAKILEQDKEKMKVTFNGKTVTYGVNEIQSVNGKPLTLEEPAPSKVPGVSVGGSPTPSMMSKRELIKKFIDLFGTRESMTKNFERMLASLPPDKSAEFKKVINVDEVIDNLVPLYDKYFTQAELEAYIAFYSSAQGQKFLKNIPLIMAESVNVNIEYYKGKFPAEKK